MKTVELDGETLTIPEAARRLGVSPSLLAHRLKKGQDLKAPGRIHRPQVPPELRYAVQGAALRKLLAELPPEADPVHHALRAAYPDGMSRDLIAQVLGISRQAVEDQERRLLKCLRERMAACSK